MQTCGICGSNLVCGECLSCRAKRVIDGQMSDVSPALTWAGVEDKIHQLEKRIERLELLAAVK